MRTIAAMLGAFIPWGGAAGTVRDAAGSSTSGASSDPGLLPTLVPILLIALAVLVVLAAGAALVLFRTRGITEPTTSEGWWTCPSCGASNMDASARCHACSTWRTTSARPTPSA